MTRADRALYWAGTKAAARFGSTTSISMPKCNTTSSSSARCGARSSATSSSCTTSRSSISRPINASGSRRCCAGVTPSAAAGRGRVHPDRRCERREPRPRCRVLREACRQARAWHDRGQPLRVAINLSQAQLCHADIVTTVEATLETTGARADCLELEITERFVMEGFSETTDRISRRSPPVTSSWCSTIRPGTQLTGKSAQPAGQQDQDRSGVHRRHRHRGKGRGAGRPDRHARPKARQAGARRGRRDRAPARVPARGRLRRSARLRDRPTGSAEEIVLGKKWALAVPAPALAFLAAQLNQPHDFAA